MYTIIQEKFFYHRYLMMYELVETKQEVTTTIAWKESPDNILTKNIDRSPEISWRNLSFSIQEKNLLKNCWGKVNGDSSFVCWTLFDNQPTLFTVDSIQYTMRHHGSEWSRKIYFTKCFIRQSLRVCFDEA